MRPASAIRAACGAGAWCSAGCFNAAVGDGTHRCEQMRARRLSARVPPFLLARGDLPCGMCGIVMRPDRPVVLLLAAGDTVVGKDVFCSRTHLEEAIAAGKCRADAHARVVLHRTAAAGAAAGST